MTIGQSLAKTCAFLHWKRTSWSATRKSTTAAARITEAGGGDARHYNASKKLVPADFGPTFHAINKLDGEAYNHVYLDRTAPTLVTGARLVSNTMSEDIEKDLAAYKRKREEMVEKFLSEEYPRVVAQAPEFLKGDFNPLDYPEPDVIRLKYTFSYRWSPVPEGKLNLVGFPADVAARIESEARAQEAELVELLSEKLENDIIKRLDYAIERLEGFIVTLGFKKRADGSFRKDARGKKIPTLIRSGTVFRDQLMNQLWMAADQAVQMDRSEGLVFQKWGQAILDAFSDGRLEGDAETLRSDDDIRHRTIHNLRDLKSRFGRRSDFSDIEDLDADLEEFRGESDYLL